MHQFFSLPPKSVVHEAFKTLIKSNSKWWCQGRFWCQNVELHPRFSSILVAVQRITEWDIQWSSFLWNNFRRFFEELDLTLEKYDAEKGVLFSRKVTECNKNVIKAFGRWRRVWSDAPDALHLIRTVCGSRTLETIKKTRWDADGADDVDIEASSRIPWKVFRKKLTKQEETWLSIFRSGASITETRRQRDEQRCSACGQEVRPSLRHLVTECSIFDAKRKAVSEE